MLSSDIQFFGFGLHKILFRNTKFPLCFFHSKSDVVVSCIHNGKEEHPCIVTIYGSYEYYYIVTIKMVTMNILTLLP